MLNITGTTNPLYCFFDDATGGVEGLTVTIDIYSPTDTLLVSAGSMTEVGGGLYKYAYLMSTAGAYPYICKTSGDVNQPHVAGLWIVGQDWVEATPIIQERTDNLPDDPASDTKVDARADEIVEDIYNLTHNEAGEEVPIVIPPPPSTDACTIYALCYDRESNLPLSSVTSQAKIISLPFYLDGKYHEGDVSEGTLADGVCSWSFVHGAEVFISIAELGILGRGTVPSTESADIHTFLE